jgi:hypothetical protein
LGRNHEHPRRVALLLNAADDVQQSFVRHDGGRHHGDAVPQRGGSGLLELPPKPDARSPRLRPGKLAASNSQSDRSVSAIYGSAQLRRRARVYSASMQRTTVLVLLLACAALVGMQLSGAHAHMDSHGFDGTVQSTHDHHHEDGHNGDIDVEVGDLGISAAKAVFLLFAFSLALFLLPPIRGHVPPRYELRLPLRRRIRWRPPLRGPPPSVSVP